MKIQILLLLLFAIAFGKKESNAIVYITFSNEKEAAIAILCVDSLIMEGKIIRAFYGTTKYCNYFLQGSTDEGNLVVTKGSVVLYLQHLDLSSKTTAPIIINSK